HRYLTGGISRPSLDPGGRTANGRLVLRGSNLNDGSFSNRLRKPACCGGSDFVSRLRFASGNRSFCQKAAARSLLGNSYLSPGSARTCAFAHVTDTKVQIRRAHACTGVPFIITPTFFRTWYDLV